MKILGSAKIREKGQITIPQEVRDALKVKPGDKICIVHDKGQILVKKEKITYEDFDLDKD